MSLWHPAFPHLDIAQTYNPTDIEALMEWIWEGGLVEAHNAFFERGIWTNILAPRHGFPLVPHDQWRCSAAKAATHALPRGLDGATEALKLTELKDLEGAELLKKVYAPRKPLKKERVAWMRQHAPCRSCKAQGWHKVGRAKRTPCPWCAGSGSDPRKPVPPMPRLWHESKDIFERIFQYCKQDVRAEEALSCSIPDLNEVETEVYLMDQAVNERGFMLDRPAIHVALAHIAKESEVLTRELVTLTGGRVERATQRERMKAWMAEQGLVLENTQAATIDALLANPPPGLVYRAKRGLEIMRALGRSSTAKYVKMGNWICPDDRVHGGLLYHGATTGRWSGQGIQPHNFPKGTLKDFDMDDAWESIMAGDGDDLNDLFGSVMEPLSQALRGAIIPTPGKALYVSDFAGIEARVLLWVAEDEAGLDIFRQGEDIYCSMASSIYGYPVTKEMKQERALGKVAILGLGYQMGWTKFIDTALKMAGIVIDEALSRQTVEAYRSKFWRVKQCWYDQELAAIDAVKRPGRRMSAGRLVWVYEDRFLYCILPSGRRLAYPFPKVSRVTKWGRKQDELSFKGVNPVTRQWHTQTTYGGMIVENIVQAISRDLLAEALLRLEQSPYVPVLSVHDEVVCEGPLDGDLLAFDKLMTTLPDWAEGCPVLAESWNGRRYKKG